MRELPFALRAFPRPHLTLQTQRSVFLPLQTDARTHRSPSCLQSGSFGCFPSSDGASLERKPVASWTA